MNVLEFLREGKNGELSSTRLVFIVWAIGVLIVWIVTSITARSLQPIDQSIALILGILLSGKVVQKFAEETTPDVKNSGVTRNPAAPNPPTTS